MTGHLIVISGLPDVGKTSVAEIAAARAGSHGGGQGGVSIAVTDHGGDGPPLDEPVKQQLVAQAKQHGRSMEAEVRDILTKAARRPHIGLPLMQAARDAGGVDDLPIPERNDVAQAAGLE